MSNPNDVSFRGRTSALFQNWWQSHVRGVEHDAVLEQVAAQGGLSHSYFFLVFASCGIATLGLLLSSPAVVIGAMLVAPLMGPITLLGFGIAKTDVRMARRSAWALLWGVLGALLASMLIVGFAPFIPPTPEILARTRPNLFDLLVAVLSGMVAGFAMIRRQNAAIAGVAIATALMPPLAVTGYGLASGAMDIFRGAFFLFLTNMLAIAFSVAFMAIWYGFGRLHTPRPLIWQTLSAGIVLALLSIPLVQTLEESVRMTRISNQVEAVLRAEAGIRHGTITSLQVRMDQSDRVDVNAVLLATKYDVALSDKVKQRLNQALGRPVDLQLYQVLEGRATLDAERNRTQLNSLLQSMEQEKQSTLALTEIARRIRSAVPFPVRMADVDSSTRQASFLIDANYRGSLGGLRQLEGDLQARYPDWKIVLVPPLRPLDPVPFVRGSAELGSDAEIVLKDNLWALRSWRAEQVKILGRGSFDEETGSAGKLAQARAEAVDGYLRKAGLKTVLAADFPASGQRQNEKERGAVAYRVALVSPQPGAVIPVGPDAAPAAKQVNLRDPDASQQPRNER